MLIPAKVCSGQQVLVVTLQVKGIDTVDRYHQYDFNYPYFILSNRQAQDSLNLTVLESNVFPDSAVRLDSNSIKHYLFLAGGADFTYLSYNEVFASQKILGIDVSAEATAAYPHGWLTHYVFNTNTGHRYGLREVISSNKQNEFARRLLADMKDSLNNHVVETMNEVRTGYRDSSELEDLHYFMDECLQEIDTESIMGCEFYFENRTLLIESCCSFPHVVKALEPIFQIPYPAISIKEFLVPEIYQQLISDSGKK